MKSSIFLCDNKVKFEYKNINNIDCSVSPSILVPGSYIIYSLEKYNYSVIIGKNHDGLYYINDNNKCTILSNKCKKYIHVKIFTLKNLGCTEQIIS